jgi:hypothetical protein
MTMQNEVYTDHEGFGFYDPAENKSSPDNALYNWVFHFNHFNNTWAAVPRDCYNLYWSDNNAAGVLRSSSIETLKALIYKTQGDQEKIEQLTREQ